jgi:ubiquinone/menaquinone biosynthesis C-methylase UbiE
MSERSIKDQTDQRFKKSDAQSYDAVVDYFHRYTQRYTAQLCQPLLEIADIPANGVVLDVGTGTGVIPLAGLAASGSGVKFVGIDLSDGMLAKAGQVAVDKGLQSRVEFFKMDAENLVFEDNSFDAVISLYALHHFPNPSRALSEIFRVLKPGGKAVIAVGSSPALLSLDGVKAVFRRLGSIWRNSRGRELSACGFIDALVEKHLPHGDEPSVTQWVEHQHGFGESVKDMLNAAGFENLASAWKGQYSTLASADDFWLVQMTFSSTARRRIQQADQDALSRLKDDFYQKCEQVLKKNGRLVYQTGAAITSGRKPYRRS